MKKLNDRISQPWLAYNESEKYEECITGNEAGLKALRSAIDKALQGEFGAIDLNFSDIGGVVKITGDSRESAVVRPSTHSEKFKMLFLAAIGIVVLAVIILVPIVFMAWFR